ncbi:hypothetical protein ACMFMG_006934 [Clarireedia jacksonii]
MATQLQAPGKEFVESLGDETVKLIVGKKRKEFTVHKQLLCESCGYFRRAFDGSFKEGQEGKMYLEEESAGAVAIFVEWLYRSRIRPTTHLRYLHDLFKLYVMAEKICLDELADRVIDAIIRSFYDKLHYYHLTLEMSSYLWGKTRKGSPMRKFIVEAIGHGYYDEIGCKTRDPENSKHDLKCLWPICKKHKDFFVMFLANFRGSIMIRDSNGEWILEETRYSPSKSCRDSAEKICQFHCHEEGYKCAAITEKIRYQVEEYWDTGVGSDFFHDLPEARDQFGVEVEA